MPAIQSLPDQYDDEKQPDNNYVKINNNDINKLLHIINIYDSDSDNFKIFLLGTIYDDQFHNIYENNQNYKLAGKIKFNNQSKTNLDVWWI